MARYITKQIIFSIIKLFAFLTVVFFLIQIIMQGNFVSQFSMFMNSAEREVLETELGLNLPIWEQYLNWLSNILKGNLGTSFRGGSVADHIKSTLPLTMLVFLTGAIISFVIGIMIGKAAAWRGPGLITSISTLASVILYTSFPPWLAWLVGTFFFNSLITNVSFGSMFGLSSSSSRIDQTSTLWRESIFSVEVVAYYMVSTLLVGIVIFFIVNAVLRRTIKWKIPALVPIALILIGVGFFWQQQGYYPQASNIAFVGISPLLTFTLLSFGETMLITRSTMTEVLGEQYIVTAKAKGLAPKLVRDKHASRNAILPVLSRVVITIPYLLTGVVIIEHQLNWPGIGTTMFNALYWQDMPMVMGGLMIVGIVALVSRLILDILYAYLDPRVRFGEAEPKIS